MCPGSTSGAARLSIAPTICRTPHCKENHTMKKRNRQKRQPSLFVKCLTSVIALGAILYFGIMAIKFCLGLSMVGDYVVQFPNESSPVVQEPTYNATEPTETDTGIVLPSETARAQLLVTGDLMLHTPILNSVRSTGEYGFDDIFQYVTPYVSKADFAVVNLETTLSGTEGGKKYTGYPKFNSPDSIVDAAGNAGFNMMLTANNHCNDYGTAGLKRTLATIQGGGLTALGTVSTTDEAGHVVMDVNGIKIGMVCYSYGQIGDDPDRPAMNGLPTDSAAAGLINAFDYNKLDVFYQEMAAQIADMQAKGAEAIVLYIHWGDEYSTTVNDKQRTMAQKLCDMGVDVIAGSHPHVVQGMELLTSTADESHKTVCLYSMGNFLSNQRSTNVNVTTGHTEDSLLLELTFVKYSDGNVYLEGVTVQPTWVLVRSSGGRREYRILPLNHHSGDWAELYGLTSSQEHNAESSYNRTMELVSPGLNTVQTYVDENRIARFGVG